MANKKVAALLCESEENIHYVYSDAQLAQLAGLTDLKPGIFSRARLAEADLSDVEVLFSTWGMPCLTDEELARLPKLEAVFYAAGATDGFARPLFAHNVKVLSAWQANAIPVAEFCVAQIILALKGYFANTRMIHSPADWSREKAYVGPGLYGSDFDLRAGDAQGVQCERDRRPLPP